MIGHDSLRVVSANLVGSGIFLIDTIPYVLQLIIACLTIWYLILKIKDIRSK
jgi:hypothetical protein